MKHLRRYRESGGDPDSRENQRIRDQVVRRMIIYNVSSLIGTLSMVIHHVSYPDRKDLGYTEDDITDLSARSATALDAALENKALFAEHDDEWYWLKPDDRPPFDAFCNPPGDQYSVCYHDGLDSDDGDTLEGGWYAGDPEDGDGPHDSEGAARVRSWENYLSDEARGPYVSEEEAAQAFCDAEDIDIRDYDSEVYEHWIVDSWYAEHLRNRGETVVEICGLTVWGRCTTGQSISMDGIVADIAAEMEILVGQRSEWSRD